MLRRIPTEASRTTRLEPPYDTNGSGSPVTEEEIHAMLAEGTTAGVIESHEHAMVRNVFRLDDRQIGSLMVPRGDLVVLDFGGVYGGYCGDLTRTVQLAPLSDEGRRVHAADDPAPTGRLSWRRMSSTSSIRPGPCWR